MLPSLAAVKEEVMPPLEAKGEALHLGAEVPNHPFPPTTSMTLSQCCRKIRIQTPRHLSAAHARQG